MYIRKLGEINIAHVWSLLLKVQKVSSRLIRFGWWNDALTISKNAQLCGAYLRSYGQMLNCLVKKGVGICLQMLVKA